ncbi:MAG: hypothetical protein K2Y25_00765 [Pseudomonadaceae bacterium]|nr:hypothetical protein [Pseudomonadaceae bacterium]
MTAWERLIANSPLPSAIAWDHLGAQAGGGPSIVQIFDSLEVALEMADLETELELNDLDAELDAADLDAEIESTTIEVDLE